MLLLNSLLASAYRHGQIDAGDYPSQSFIDIPPPPSIPQPLLDLATDHPLTAIATLGALSGLIFASSLVASAALIRRLTHRPLRRALLESNFTRLNHRLDDLERRMGEGMSSLGAKQARGLEGVKKEMVSKIGGSRDSGLITAASAPIAPKADDARLGQVVRDAVEDVLGSRGSPLLSKGVPQWGDSASVESRSELDDHFFALEGRVRRILSQLSCRADRSSRKCSAPLKKSTRKCRLWQ